MTRAETGQNRTAAARSGDDAEVRLGVIGLGRMGAMHADNAARIPGLRVVAVSDPHGPSLEAAVARLGAAGHACPGGTRALGGGRVRRVGGGLRRGLRRLARRSRRARPGGTRAALAADPGEERTDLDRLAFGDEDLAHGPVRG